MWVVCYWPAQTIIRSYIYVSVYILFLYLLYVEIFTASGSMFTLFIKGPDFILSQRIDLELDYRISFVFDGILLLLNSLCLRKIVCDVMFYGKLLINSDLTWYYILKFPIYPTHTFYNAPSYLNCNIPLCINCFSFKACLYRIYLYAKINNIGRSPDKCCYISRPYRLEILRRSRFLFQFN